MCVNKHGNMLWIQIRTYLHTSHYVSEPRVSPENEEKRSEASLFLQPSHCAISVYSRMLSRRKKVVTRMEWLFMFPFSCEVNSAKNL